MPPKVSVIVPVYNAAPYLAMAIGSALAQSLASIEVLCVDDASTDASLTLLRAIAVQDPRVRVLALPENRGASAARNAGMAAARGDFLFFLDADDSLPPSGLGDLLGAAESTGCSMAIGRLCWLREPLAMADLTQLQSNPAKASVVVSNLSESTYMQSVSGSHCCNLYERRMMEAAGIRYDEDLTYGEDQLFQACAFAAAGPVAFVDNVVYVYHHYRLDSVTRRPTMLSHLIDSVEFRCRIARMFTAKGLGETVRSSLGGWSYAIREYWLQIPGQLNLAEAGEFFNRFRAMANEFDIKEWSAATPAVHRQLLDVVLEGRDAEAYHLLGSLAIRGAGPITPPAAGSA